jgi:hypothetical protein
LLIRPTNAPSTTAYATTRAGLAIRENEMIRPSTRPTTAAPIQAGPSSASGTSTQAAAAETPVMPSSVTVLTTTSSMVIGCTAGGAAGYPSAVGYG